MAENTNNEDSLPIIHSIEGIANEAEIQLSHVQQQLNWDCGIACVGMVIGPEQGASLLKNTQQIADEEGFGRSVWTIDIAYLLKRYGISCTYYTITYGVNSGYSKEKFYTEIMVIDEERVKKRFESAEDSSIPVVFRTLDLDEILRHLSTFRPAIVLINAYILRCVLCESICNPGALVTCGCLSGKVAFHGHFIVLCGFNLSTHLVYFRNPCYKDRVCHATFGTFEKARRSFGTDDDVILLNSFVGT